MVVIVIDTAAANAILFAPRRILFLYFSSTFLAVDVETVVQPVDRIPAQRAYDGI